VKEICLVVSWTQWRNALMGVVYSVVEQMPSRFVG
jgi:hypothetical protein